MTSEPPPRPAGLDKPLNHVADNLPSKPSCGRALSTGEPCPDHPTEQDVWAGITPEDIDAWLRVLIPDDKRLAFYQWIGAQAVAEAIEEIRHVAESYELAGMPRKNDVVWKGAEAIQMGGPYPTQLPNGAGRLPACRLDSEDST